MMVGNASLRAMTAWEIHITKRHPTVAPRRAALADHYRALRRLGRGDLARAAHAILRAHWIPYVVPIHETKAVH